MNSFPNLSEWNLRLSQQAGGFALWFGAVVIISLIALRLRRKHPLVTRLAGLGGFLALFGIAGRDYLPYLPFLGVFGVLAYKWLPFLPKRLKPIHLLLLGAALVRLPGLWQDALWFDETFTAGLARLDYASLLKMLKADLHPPVWYSLEWVTARILGSSEAALRFPSFLFGVLVVYLIYRLAKAFQMPERTALLAAAIVCFLPAALYYSNEARPYSMLAAAILGMAIAILEDRPLWFAACAVLAVYSHNLGWVYFGCLMVAGNLYHPHSWDWKLSSGVAAGLGGTWIPTLLQQSRDIADGFWLQPLKFGEIPRLLIYMTAYIKIPENLLLPVTGGIVGVSTLSVVFGLRWLLSRPGRVYLMLILAPPLIIAAVSLVWHNVFLERAMLASGLGMSILWAKLLTQSYKADRLVAAGILTPVLVAAFLLYYDTKMGRFDARDLLPQACAGTDVAYTTTVAMEFIASYYLPKTVMWPGANDLNQTLPQWAKNTMGFQQQRFEDLSGRICLLEIKNSLNRVDEQRYLGYILSTYPPQSSRVIFKNNVYFVEAHIIEVHRG